MAEIETDSPLSVPENTKLNIDEFSSLAKIPSKFLLSGKFKIYLLVSIMIFLALGVTLLAIFLKNPDIKVHEYKKTQYEALVRTNVTVLSKSKSSTTSDSFYLTFFALDMVGDKYRFLLTNASTHETTFNSSLGELKSDYFMYLELESKTGKILETRYKEESFDEKTVNLLTGIMQVFVVDQDSEWEYAYHCKKKYEEWQKCSKNSKKQASEYILFERKESSSDRLSKSDSEFEHSSTTWLNKEGKVEKSSFNGWYSKSLDQSNPDEKISFNVSATAKIISETNLNDSDLYEFENILNDLPHVNQSSDYKIAKFDTFLEDNTPEEDDNEPEGDENEPEEDFPENLIKESIDRKLTSDEENEYSLFYETNNYKFFSFYDIPLRLNSILYSVFDENFKAWFCIIHRLKYGDISMKLIKKDFCLSSNEASPRERKKIKKWVRKVRAKAYLLVEKFSIFTFRLYGEVKVKNTPHLSVYYNDDGNIATNGEIVSKISVSITGEVSVGIAKCGLTFKNTMASNINNLMTGYYPSFMTYVSLDKSLEANFEIWIKYLTLGYDCWKIFGIKICLPTIEYSDKKTLYEETYDYHYYDREYIFQMEFG